MPDGRIAIIDACVLVQAPLRDTLLRLAEPPALYLPLWIEDIIIEMKRALERQIGLAPSKAAYLERELRRHFPDSWVAGYEPLIRKMTNDEKDRHVLAAAVRARAPKIVTFNRRHFSPAATSRWHVEAVGPAAFLEISTNSPRPSSLSASTTKPGTWDARSPLNSTSSQRPFHRSSKLVRKDLKHRGD